VNLASTVTLVLLALTLALQPWSVLAAILLVTSYRGVLKVSLFVVGWMLALGTVFALTVWLVPPQPATSSSRQAQSIIEITCGVLLAGFMVIRWRRPVKADAKGTPAWLGRLDSMSPILALVLGAFLPNYVVVVAAVNEVVHMQVSSAAMAAWGVGFVLLASIGVAAPLGVLVVRRDRAPATYEAWREWLVSHSREVSYATVILIALLLVVKGVIGLV